MKASMESDFVLLRVFSILPNVDLLRASRVCKYWSTICLDPMFEWAKIFNCQAECTDVKMQMAVSRVKCIIKVDNISYIVDDVHGKLGRLVVEPISLCNFDWCVQAAALAESLPKLWKVSVSAALSPRGTKLSIKVEVNVKEFNRIQKYKEEDAEESEKLLASGIQWRVDRTFSQNDLGAVKPIGFTGSNGRYKIESPRGIVLHDYQKEAVEWMLMTELRQNKYNFRGLELDYLRVPHQLPILYSRKYQRFVEFGDALMHLPFITPKGGFLMEDIGLGKTAEIISVMLSNPLPYSQVNHKNKQCSILDKSVTSYLYLSKATLVLCPVHIVLQWKTEIAKHAPLNYRVVVLSNMKDLNEHNYNDIQSADVVIAAYDILTNPAYYGMGCECASPTSKSGSPPTKLTSPLSKPIPSPLSSSKLFSPNSPFSKHFLSPLTKSSSLPSFFSPLSRSISSSSSSSPASSKPSSPTYCPPVLKTSTSLPDFSALRPTYLSRYLSTLKTEHDQGLQHKCPLLELFHYHRIVLDEGHELSDDRLCRAIGFFNASNWWVASSTPIEPSSTRTKLASYMGLLGDMDRKYCDSMIYDYFMWRNTKHVLASVEEHIVLIPDFVTPLERNTYEIMELQGEDRQDMFCSHPFQKKLNETLYQWHNSLSDKIFQDMVNALATIKKNQSKSEQLKKKHQKCIYALASIYLTDSERDSVEKKSHVTLQKRNKAERQGEEFAKLFCEYLWRYNIVGGVQNEEATGVDLSSYNILEPVTDRAVHKHGSNPPKRRKNKNKLSIQELEEELVREYSLPQKEPTTDKPNELMLHCANMYGTKITYMMVYLRNIWLKEPNAKVLIFSQHSEVLDTVSVYLKRCGVASVILKENTAQINGEQVDKFAKTDVRVMLLDFVVAAGTSIVSAPFVVFLDPLNSRNRPLAAQVEAQALGKAHRLGQTKNITLLKFVMADTIEHETFLAIHPSLTAKSKKRHSIPKLSAVNPTKQVSVNVSAVSPNQQQQQLKALVDNYNQLIKAC